MKLQYYGSVLDLDGFLGPISVTGSFFYNNVLQYSNCDAAYYMEQNND